MLVLVTGGTGLVAAALLPELQRRGHEVRIASRHARAWAERLEHVGVHVEAVDVDVTEEGGTLGAAEGCDAVVHLVGLMDSEGSDARYYEVNTAGTRQVVEEATRAGLRRFVHVSTLGAERGSSAYHVSKLRSETVVSDFEGAWTVLRPGMVIGPRDQTTTLLLRMLRLAPFVPLVHDGRRPLQPIWHEDLGRAIAATLEREDLASRVLPVAGPDVTTPRDLVEALASLIDKRARIVRLPARSTPLVARIVEAAGFTPTLEEAKLAMLFEGSVVDPPEANALERLLDGPPTPVRTALFTLLHDLPVQPLTQGYGPLRHKRYSAAIERSKRSAETVVDEFRERCVELMPLDFEAEPGSARRLAMGSTLSLRVPLRGQMLMRVIDVAPAAVTMATVAGHPISGVVRFSCERAGGALRSRDATTSNGALAFTVDVYARASNRLDRLALAALGGRLQNANWKAVARRGARLARGHVGRRVAHRTELLRGAEAGALEDAMARLAEQIERPATMT